MYLGIFLLVGNKVQRAQEIKLFHLFIASIRDISFQKLVRKITALLLCWTESEFLKRTSPS